MLSVLLTGASGFIGGRLAALVSDDFYLRQIFRVEPSEKPISDYVLCEINDDCNWSKVLKGIDVVVHCAGRAHLLNDKSNDPIAEFRKVNVDMTLCLAQAAVDFGIKRFVFLSSIGVNGNMNSSPFLETDIPLPIENYAISKLEAEQGLRDIALSSGLEVVIIRPPLVYGANAPGNFGKLMQLSYKNIPLPFGVIKNNRSFIALDNLVSFIALCIDHPKAANEIFLISDGEDVSTTELLQKVAKAFGKKSFLIPVPVGLMTFFAKLLGKEDVANRLFGSLQVDSSKARNLLNWKPVISMDEQLKKATAAYLNEKII